MRPWWRRPAECRVRRDFAPREGKAPLQRCDGRDAVARSSKTFLTLLASGVVETCLEGRSGWRRLDSLGHADVVMWSGRERRCPTRRMRRGRVREWPGGALVDGGDRTDVVTAGSPSDHHDPGIRDDADHDSWLHDDREAPDGPAPHCHPETLTASATCPPANPHLDIRRSGTTLHTPHRSYGRASDKPGASLRLAWLTPPTVSAWRRTRLSAAEVGRNRRAPRGASPSTHHRTGRGRGAAEGDSRRCVQLRHQAAQRQLRLPLVTIDHFSLSWPLACGLLNWVRSPDAKNALGG